MLQELHIRDFAIIDDLTLRFAGGFNVVTGETGAGKSIIMQAVQLLCGGRASPEVVRTGAEEASLEGVFDLEPEEAGAAEALGLRTDDVLVVRRTISRSSKSRVYVNGGLANLAVLEQIGDQLLHVYGQQDQILLLRADTHLELVDAYAGHTDLVAAVAGHHAALEHSLDRLTALRSGQDAARQREELVRFQLEELQAARIEAGEDERLRRERELLVHAERLAQVYQQGEDALYAGDDAVADRLARVAALLRDGAHIDPRLEELQGLLDTARVQVQEVAHQLRTHGDRLSVDPERLAAVDDRLALLHRLARKYGGSLEAALAAQAALAEELAGVERIDADLDEQEREVAARARAAWDTAVAVSRSRRAAARRLEKQVAKELRSLGMQGAALHVVFAPDTVDGRFDPQCPLAAGEARLDRRGADRVEFHLTANPGEAPKTLARIASGGELSRIMLALKVLTAGVGDASTMIFDEVDAGIGGQVASAVGDRLRALGATRQVLCITHLPQIAARATHHFVVEKHTRNGRTVSAARRLGRDERVAELSRMLGGVDSAEAARFARRLVATLDGGGGPDRRGAPSR